MDSTKIDTLRERVSAVSWYHKINLGDGIITPGLDDSPSKLVGLKMPEDLKGLSVLDIGAWDGFFSFEAERRGARRVLATDSFRWEGPGPTTKAGFELARGALNSNVEDKVIDVLDLSPETVGVFDLVLFLGVLYHMRHPLLALERVFSVTRPGGQLLLETHLDLTWLRRPAIAFYPGAGLMGNPTNWCGPNQAAVEAMLKTVGFSKIEKVSDTSGGPLRRIARGVKRRIINRTPVLTTFQFKRAVFHAWR